MKAPQAKKIPHEITLHGDTRQDHYSWLCKRENPAVLQYLEAENKHTEAIMASTRGLQETLFAEMKGRIQEDDESVPSRVHGFYYYTRTLAGRQYRIHCRKRGSLEAAEEIILDENELSSGHGYFRVGACEVSPDGKFLAYSVDTEGSEQYTLFIKDLSSGVLSPERIGNTYPSLAWANDSKTFFYITLDAATRPHKLMRHRIGADVLQDQAVFEEPDELFSLSVSRTRSERYILLNVESPLTSEYWYVDADDLVSGFRVFCKRTHGVEYHIEHAGEYWYMLTNQSARNFKVMRVQVSNPEPEQWEEYVAHGSDRTLESITAFKEFLVVVERSEATRKLLIIDTVHNTRHYAALPDESYALWFEDNEEFDDQWLRFVYSSFTTPDTVFDYHMRTRERVLKKQEQVLGYDPSGFISERLWAVASDGARVPVSLVYKKGIEKNGQNPVWLYGYGAYGTHVDPQFSSMRLSLLERGFIYAIAQVRGGGDMGREWYEDGKFLKKKNTFTDYISCAEHLIKEGYTSAGRMVAYGGSAGGLLMGAIANMRPDLFGAVIANVPFVDSLNTMLDASLPLTVGEYEEWGDPAASKVYYEYLKEYAPYENIRAGEYPHMLVLAGLNDPRVAYWEPAKFVAKLRACKTDENLLLLKTNLDAGHHGASGRYDFLREIAFTYAFALLALNILEPMSCAATGANDVAEALPTPSSW